MMQHGNTISHATASSSSQILGNNFSAAGNNIISINSATSDDVVERKKCLRALFVTSPADDRAKYISFKGRIITAAFAWIIKTDVYRSWLSPSTGSRLLWVSGGAGTGKTMLSIFLTEELERGGPEKGLVVYYFCEGRDPKRNSPINILRGIMYSLVQQRPQLMKHILPDYEVQQEALFNEYSIEALWRILTQMIRDPETGPVYCIVDGLDECAQTSVEHLEHIVKKFASFFSDDLGRESPGKDLRPVSTAPSVPGPAQAGSAERAIANASTSVFKLALVSREEPECLMRHLSTFQRLQLGVPATLESQNTDDSPQGSVHATTIPAGRTSITDARNSTKKGTDATLRDETEDTKGPSAVDAEDSAGYSDSLSVYIQARVAELSETKSFNKVNQQSLIDTLRRGGDGTFLWVDMAIRRMTNSALLDSEQALSNLLSGTEGMLCLQLLEIPQHLAAVAAFVLRWVSTAFRPLKMKELSELLYFLDGKPNGPILNVLLEAINVCGTLADVSEGQEVKLGHQTIKDLLTNPSSVLLGDKRLQHFFVNEKQTHAEITQASISYLEQSPFKSSWYHLVPFTGEYRTEVETEPDWAIMEMLPFLHYAVANWPHHMRNATPGTVNLSSPFFSPGSDLRKNWFHSAWEMTFGQDGDLSPSFQSTLHIAAFFDLHELAELEARRPDFATRLEKKNSEFKTPVVVAAERGSVEVLAFFLDRGANPVVLGRHIIVAACRLGRLKAVQLLLDRGVDVNVKVTENLAIKGARMAVRHTPKKYWDKIAGSTDKNQQDYLRLYSQDFGSGMAPLHYAVACGNEEIAKLLIARGANIRQGTSTNWDAIHMAAWAGQTRIIEILAQHDGDVRAITSNNWTALHCAAWQGKVGAGECLIRLEVNVNALSKHSETPLHFASSQGREAMVRMLLAHGAQVEVKTSKGFTALHLAAQEGHDKAITALLDHGAKRDAAMKLAKGGKSSTTALLLRDYRLVRSNSQNLTPGLLPSPLQGHLSASTTDLGTTTGIIRTQSDAVRSTAHPQNVLSVSGVLQSPVQQAQHNHSAILERSQSAPTATEPLVNASQSTNSGTDGYASLLSDPITSSVPDASALVPDGHSQAVPALVKSPQQHQFMAPVSVQAPAQQGSSYSPPQQSESITPQAPGLAITPAKLQGQLVTPTRTASFSADQSTGWSPPPLPPRAPQAQAQAQHLLSQSDNPGSQPKESL